jgi:hypothetical protein
MAHPKQSLIDAIRKHPKIGLGTCTYVDEAFTDNELVERLDEEGITDSEKAIKYFLDLEGLLEDQEEDIRNA